MPDFVLQRMENKYVINLAQYEDIFGILRSKMDFIIQ